MLSARGAGAQARRRKEEGHRKGRDAGSRFGGDAGAEGRSAELGQMDEQVGEQAEEALSSQGHTIGETAIRGAVTRDGIFAQSQQEAD